MRRRRARWIAPASLVALIVVTTIWASDRITLQGERTIYTVECVDGAWDGDRCGGRLVPGPRYAFRASVRRHEVIYWIRDSAAPSGKYTDCTVTNRDNWRCSVQRDQPMPLTFAMHDGRPTGGGAGLTVPFHEVPKWKWWAIRAWRAVSGGPKG
jgi:hypothetical protein